MLLDIVAGLLGSPLTRAVAFDIATTLLCQVIQHTVTTAARLRTETGASQPETSTPETGDAPPADTATPTIQEAGSPPWRALPTVEIISSVTGRARLRLPGVRGDAARAAEVAATVRGLEGVTSAQANPRTGTLLVHFGPAETNIAEIVAELETSVEPRRRAATSVPYLRLVVG